MSDPDLARVAERLAALRRAIGRVAGEADRALVRDAVRDALDRDAAAGSDARIVANSFTRLRTLHRGPCFEVHLVRQRDLGTLHALKTQLVERASDPLLRRLLLDEARHQERVRHPACLPLRAVLRLGDGRPAVLTDHVAAPTLAEILRERRLGYGECMALGLRLAGALGAVHAAGLVHGDLSPGNVFLPDGDAADAILFDFGLSRPLDARLRAADLAGAFTADFAALETHAPDAVARTATDLFSLGRLLEAACAPDDRWMLDPVLAPLLREDPAHRSASAESAAHLFATCGRKATTDVQTVNPSSTESVSTLMNSSGRVMSWR